MKYNIELNIIDCSVRLVKVMKDIGENNDFKVFHHGYDRLVFESDSGKNFNKLITELSNVCKVYNTDYIKLLDLD